MARIIASVTPNNTQFGPLLYPGELERAIQELGELGYDGIELSLRTPQDVDRNTLENMLSRANMQLISIATGQSFIEDGYAVFHEDELIRKQTAERIRGYVDLIASMGGKSVILGGIKGKLGPANPEQQFAHGAATIDSCLEYAEKKQVMLLLEAINRYETNIMVTVESCAEFAEKRDSPYLKVLADTFHMNIEEVSLKGSLDTYAKHIGAIHCADSNRLAPGMGHVDFHEVLKDIGQYPYLQYLGVEVLPLPDSHTCAETAIHTLRRITHREK